MNTADVAWSASTPAKPAASPSCSGGTGLSLEVLLKPEIRAASEVEMPADYDPFGFGLLPGDQYIVTSGAMKGQRGFFTRDDGGAVVGADLAGRLFTRVS